MYNDFAKWFTLRLRQIRMEIILLIRAINESYEKKVALEASRIAAGKSERIIFLSEEGIKE